MEINEVKLKLTAILQEWDPLKMGEEAYDNEIQHVIHEVGEHHHPSDLAKRIQGIYQSSFQQWLPLQDCTKISYKLLAVKMEAAQS